MPHSLHFLPTKSSPHNFHMFISISFPNSSIFSGFSFFLYWILGPPIPISSRCNHVGEWTEEITMRIEEVTREREEVEDESDGCIQTYLGLEDKLVPG